MSILYWMVAHTICSWLHTALMIIKLFALPVLTNFVQCHVIKLQVRHSVII